MAQLLCMALSGCSWVVWLVGMGFATSLGAPFWFSLSLVCLCLLFLLGVGFSVFMGLVVGVLFLRLGL